MNELLPRLASEQIAEIDFTSLQSIPETNHSACYIANNFSKTELSYNPISEDLIDFITNHFLAKQSSQALPSRRVCFPIRFQQNTTQKELIAVLSCDNVAETTSKSIARIIESYAEHDSDPKRLKSYLLQDSGFTKLVKSLYQEIELTVFIPDSSGQAQFVSPDLYDILKEKLQTACYEATTSFKAPHLLAVEFANIDFCLSTPENLPEQVRNFVLHDEIPQQYQVIANFCASDNLWEFKFEALKVKRSKRKTKLSTENLEAANLSNLSRRSSKSSSTPAESESDSSELSATPLPQALPLNILLIRDKAAQQLRAEIEQDFPELTNVLMAYAEHHPEQFITMLWQATRMNAKQFDKIVECYTAYRRYTDGSHFYHLQSFIIQAQHKAEHSLAAQQTYAQLAQICENLISEINQIANYLFESKTTPNVVTPALQDFQTLITSSSDIDCEKLQTMLETALSELCLRAMDKALEQENTDQFLQILHSDLVKDYIIKNNQYCGFVAQASFRLQTAANLCFQQLILSNTPETRYKILTILSGDSFIEWQGINYLPEFSEHQLEIISKIIIEALNYAMQSKEIYPLLSTLNKIYLHRCQQQFIPTSIAPNPAVATLKQQIKIIENLQQTQIEMTEIEANLSGIGGIFRIIFDYLFNLGRWYKQQQTRLSELRQQSAHKFQQLSKDMAALNLTDAKHKAELKLSQLLCDHELREQSVRQTHVKNAYENTVKLFDNIFVVSQIQIAANNYIQQLFQNGDDEAINAIIVNHNGIITQTSDKNIYTVQAALHNYAETHLAQLNLSDCQRLINLLNATNTPTQKISVIYTALTKRYRQLIENSTTISSLEASELAHDKLFREQVTQFIQQDNFDVEKFIAYCQLPLIQQTLAISPEFKQFIIASFTKSHPSMALMSQHAKLLKNLSTCLDRFKSAHHRDIEQDIFDYTAIALVTILNSPGPIKALQEQARKINQPSADSQYPRYLLSYIVDKIATGQVISRDELVIMKHNYQLYQQKTQAMLQQPSLAALQDCLNLLKIPSLKTQASIYSDVAKIVIHQLQKLNWLPTDFEQSRQMLITLSELRETLMNVLSVAEIQKLPLQKLTEQRVQAELDRFCSQLKFAKHNHQCFSEHEISKLSAQCAVIANFASDQQITLLVHRIIEVQRSTEHQLMHPQILDFQINEIFQNASQINERFRALAENAEIHYFLERQQALPPTRPQLTCPTNMSQIRDANLVQATLKQVYDKVEQTRQQIKVAFSHKAMTKKDIREHIVCEYFYLSWPEQTQTDADLNQCLNVLIDCSVMVNFSQKLANPLARQSDLQQIFQTCLAALHKPSLLALQTHFSKYKPPHLAEDLKQLKLHSELIHRNQLLQELVLMTKTFLSAAGIGKFIHKHPSPSNEDLLNNIACKI